MRRRDRRIRFIALGVFVAAVSLSFLLGHLGSNSADAADLSKFDPGFIISDYTMSNYNSMSEAEIQAFLTRKNPCNERSYDYYLSLTANNPGVYWHWKDDHFVCISEELFGEGTTIGEGKTAARIIYETAQEYRINPQVLLVLIQKESSLITDPIPNNYDYRAMTGFGCPDTAPCDAKYYGFKNQIRKAAWLFREVLDGGWTNYPLGENYVQYNPNAGCGGSIVNIRNLATSALYRYTPYQPNAGAIAAGYGTAYCGAYGNRNFYLYFEDWFGGITDAGWYGMETQRIFQSKNGIFMYNGNTQEIVNEQPKEVDFYTSKIIVNNQWCLRTQADQRANRNRCVLISDLLETDWVERYSEALYYRVERGALKVNRYSGSEFAGQDEEILIDKFIVLPSQNKCFVVGHEQCVPEKYIKPVEFIKYGLETPRYMRADNAKYVNYSKTTGSIDAVQMINGKKYFKEKVLLPTGEWCLVVDNAKCATLSSLEEVWQPMQYPRELKTNVQTYKRDIITGDTDESLILPESMIRKYVQKSQMDDGSWCLKTEYDYERNTNKCVIDYELDET